MRHFITFLLIFLSTSCNSSAKQGPWEQYESEIKESLHYYKKFYGNDVNSFHESLSIFPQKELIKSTEEIKAFLIDHTRNNMIMSNVMKTIRFNPDLIMWNNRLRSDSLAWQIVEKHKKEEIMLFGSLPFEFSNGKKIFAATTWNQDKVYLDSPPEWAKRVQVAE